MSSGSTPVAKPQEPMKEKKTRRRLRLSCVECTKRRQKCDRNHPCSLCVTRGVSHLCRWESVPVARPPPARPPASALKHATAPDAESDAIVTLKKRIAALEQELQETRKITGSPSSTHSSSSRTLSTPTPDLPTNIILSPAQTSERPLRSPPPSFTGQHYITVDDEPELRHPRNLLDEASYEVTSSLAQLSLGHHGEFIGRGSVICALHSMTHRKMPRFLYAKSTDIISDSRHESQRFSTIPFVATIEELVSYLPPMLVTEALTSAFFHDVNWRYGIPEDWFRRSRGQMWMSLQNPQVHASQINANWLVLLFAILASAPQSSYDSFYGTSTPTRRSEDYFMCAVMAQRMADEAYLDSPNVSCMASAADGTVLGCLATPLLCEYLAARGRPSEAWKMVGSAVHNAIAVGLHRDPEWRLWQMMSADENLLRRRAWWGLYMSDKIFATVLSRPQAIRKDVWDVSLFPQNNTDGSRNLLNHGQNVMVGLMQLLGDVHEKCLTRDFPDCQVYFAMDRKLQDWAERLPPEYQLKADPAILKECSPAEMKILTRQRYTLHTWYLTGRLKLFIASSTGLGRNPQAADQMRRTNEECVLLCMQVIRFQTAACRSQSQPSDGLSVPTYPGSCWLFEGCFSLFEASVALITVMSQLSWQEKLAEYDHAVDSAIFTFEEVAKREQGRKTSETAVRAIEVLMTIREQHWPKISKSPVPRVKVEPLDSNVMDPFVLMDVEEVQHSGINIRLNTDSYVSSMPHIMHHQIMAVTDSNRETSYLGYS